MRTKDFEEAIRWQTDAISQCKVLEYQPGNGTRYVLMFTKVPQAACDGIGANKSSWLVSLPDGAHSGHCAVFKEGGWLDPSYVMEKLGFKLSQTDDVLVLTEIIGRILNRPTPSALDEDGYRTRVVGIVQDQ